MPKPIIVVSALTSTPRPMAWLIDAAHWSRRSQVIVQDVDAVVHADAQDQRKRDHVRRIEREAAQLP